MSNFYDSDLADGTAQSERFHKALRPGYFALDEMSQEQLLVLGKKLAENLKFIDLNDEWDGESTWANLLDKDPAFILADIASTDTAKLEATYRACDGKQPIFARAVLICRLVATIERWSCARQTSGYPQIALIKAEIRQIIENSLASKLAVIDKILAGERGEMSPTIHRLRGRIRAVWEPLHSGATQTNIPVTRAKQLRYLDDFFYRFVGAITYLKTLAGASQDTAAVQRDQNPAVSLFIAFLKLYSRAQDTMNEFPKKRLDFYYSRLLGAARQPRRPDLVNLALTLAPGQPATIVPKGTQFLAGKDADDRDIVFASDEDLTLTNAAVRFVRTYYLNHDPLISPHNELGCVTRIGANEFDATTANGAGMPLFGASASPCAREAEVGLAIASPLLHLREGERKIKIDIECENAGLSEPDDEAPLPEDSQQAIVLLDRESQTTQTSVAARRRQFSRRLGQVFARELMSSSDWLSDVDKAVIRTAASRVFGPDSAKSQTIAGLLAQDRTALFYHWFRDSLLVRMTTAQGWSLRNNYIITPLPQRSGSSVAGLRLEISLSASDPAIVAYDRSVHGDDFPTDQPVISLRMNGNSMSYAYSLFAAFDIRTVEIEVDVREAKALVAYNNLGRLDSSKPFMPFGPQPSRDSYLAIGNYEAARKPLTQACLNIDWGDLPREFGGFKEYYRGYAADFSGDSFKMQTSVLAHSGWTSSQSDPQLLFNTVVQTGQISSDCCLDLLRGIGFVALESGLPESDYSLDNFSQAGFFRIDLSPSEKAFGHAEYPQLMTEILTANAKRRKPLPMPRPPYTPMINKLSFDYSAQSSIRFRSETAPHGAAPENKLFHEHPFGSRELAQSGRERPVPLMPRFQHDGYLLLGLSSSGPPGIVSLLFDLDGGETQSIEQHLNYDWFYLSGNEFKQLPHDALLRDTTADFSFTGIVTIELPDDIDSANTILEGQYYWIAIGARGDLSLCPRLHAVRSGALRGVRQISDDDAGFVRLAAGTISEAISAPAAIGSIEQLGDSFGGRAAEDRDRLIARTAERLHHKDRACQPRDYERLVLDRFPDVYKVKCFANMSMTHDRAMPGQVLVVVVPDVIEASTGHGQQLLVNAGRLDQIRRYLAEKTSRFANISVRNAAYEMVQIRCSVKLIESRHYGKYVRELNQVISDFISPWRPGGYGANFGWRIRRKDIEACIGALSYVEFVTDFSMLHITQQNDQTYCLQDTARPEHLHTATPATEVEHQTEEIVPRYPWSLALPSRRHFVQTMTEIADRKPQPTGVGELEVGNTLILDAGNGNG